MGKRSITAVAGVLVLAAAAAGCGSSGNGSTEPLTKSEFIKKADAVCSSAEKRLAGKFEAFAKEHHLSRTKPPTPAQSEEAAKKVLIPNLEAELREIRAVGAPEGESQQVDELLSTVEAAIEEGRQNPAGFIEEGGRKTFAKADRMAREFGLKVCGQEGEGGEAEGHGGKGKEGEGK